MTNRIQNLDTSEKVKGSKDLQREIHKLKSLKSSFKKNKVIGHSSKKIKEGSIRDSWQSALSDRDLGDNLKQDEIYQKIIQSKSQDNLTDIVSQKYQSKHKFQMVRENTNSQTKQTREISSSKPFALIRQSMNTDQSLNSNDKTRQDIVNNTLQSNYKAKIDYSFKSESSPTKILEESSMITGSNINVYNDQTDLTFNEISKYLDKETKLYLQISKSNQSLSTNQAYQPHHIAKNSLNDSRQEEIIRKLVQSNSNFCQNDSVLSIPQELLNEIEEYGLDSMSILQTVIGEFQHLFRQNKSKDKTIRLKGQQNMKLQRDYNNKQDLMEQANVFTLNNK